MVGKKELNLEELEKASGGRAQGTSLRPHGQYIPADQAEKFVGQNVYVVYDKNEDRWALCRLENVQSLDSSTLYDLVVKETPNDQVISIDGQSFKRGKKKCVFSRNTTLFLE